MTQEAVSQEMLVKRLKRIEGQVRGISKMVTEGRFDANFTPRVQVIAEALAGLVSADHLMISGFLPHDSIIPYEDRLTYTRVEVDD